jgi:hypothetical protein
MNQDDIPIAELLELQDLLEILNENELTPEQDARLQQIVARYPSARQYYLETMFFFGHLHWKAAHQEVEEIHNPLPKPASILGFLGDSYRWGSEFFSRDTPFALLLIFILVGLSLIGSYWMVNALDRQIAISSAKPVYVAQITDTKECKWSTNMTPLTDTKQLQVGQQLELEKGMAKIIYSNKAVVVLEGPVSYTVDTPKSGYLSQGKLTVRADTEQSRQFTIATPDARFIDLGTEFGVMIDAQGRAAIAVFQGKVMAESKLAGGRWSAPVPLIEGDAAVCVGREFTQQVARRSSYPTMQPLSPRQLWQDASREFQTYPNLVAYYDFEPDPNNRTVLPNRATTGADFDGKIQGAAWAEGRFPGKNALQFKNAKGGVRVNIPQEMSTVTLVAWVNVESLTENKEDNHNSIFMADCWKTPYATHWFMRTDGCLRIAMQNKEGDLPDLGIGDGKAILQEQKTPEWTSVNEHFGQWCMLATVYDPLSQTITSYVNGRAVHTISLTQCPRVKFGQALIGAWYPYDDKKVQACMLDGRMDELMIFERALSSEEIQKIYEAGKP